MRRYKNMTHQALKDIDEKYAQRSNTFSDIALLVQRNEEREK